MTKKYCIKTLTELEKRIHLLEIQSDFITLSNGNKLTNIEHDCYLRALQAVKNNIKAMIYE